MNSNRMTDRQVEETRQKYLPEATQPFDCAACEELMPVSGYCSKEHRPIADARIIVQLAEEVLRYKAQAKAYGLREPRQDEPAFRARLATPGVLTLAEIVSKRAALEEQLMVDNEALIHRETVLQRQVAELKKLEEAGAVGLEGAVQKAKTVLVVSGKVTESAAREKLLREAAVDLANGAPKMRVKYFGLKNYDRFIEQEEDHEYGYGPKHGSIVFSIGLKPAGREQPLEADTIEAGVRVLLALADKKITEL